MIPFAAWVKNYFRENKKFGSRDRKNILQLCYGYFRLGKAFSFLSDEDRLLAGLFLSVQSSHPLLSELKHEWNNAVQFNLKEKILLIGNIDELEKVFPFQNYLSKEIDQTAFAISHLEQPLMFLRARPGKEKVIHEKLINHGLDFSQPIENAFSLNIGIRIEEIIHLNREAVVQDLNSQQSMIVSNVLSKESELKAWDCCAASGGKSILLMDQFNHVELWVSDIRDSIIANLKKRFLEAGIRKYHSFVADVSRKDFSIQQKFDLIICDAPCTGSGTWSRTPEQLLFFKEEKIEYYASLQRKIALNAMKQLKPGGYFLYITCSVFAEENERQVEYLAGNSSLQVVEQVYLKGYGKRADSLFAALIRN